MRWRRRPIALVLAMLGDVLAAVGAARSIGHIGVISADREASHAVVRARLDGYRRALREAGLNFCYCQ